MKTINYRRSALVLITAGLLFGQSEPGGATNFSSHARRFSVAATNSVQPAKGSAQLIVRRIPNLGNFATANLVVDGVAVPPISYGRTYVGLLRPGRHVLSVKLTPSPRWSAPWTTELEVRDGETYVFTAEDNGSGNLILSRD